jgi:membrane-anchored protein YejM (alkaline phosphatase superfamily)
MTDADRLAMKRYYLIVAVNMIGTAGAVLGLLIAGRAQEYQMTLFGATVLMSSLYVMAVVPKSLARRWKTPAEAPPEA